MRYAHSANIHGHKEPVIDHLYEVARLASDFAAVWNQADEALCTGFYHDLGKYGDLFQQVLSRQAVHVDHAAPGAVAMLNKYGVAGLAGAIAIQGHHDGLITGLYTEFKKITDLSQPISYDGKKFSSIDVDYLLNILEKDMKKDKCKTPTTVDSKYPELFKNNVPISAMLYIRMLYSALVDADFLATEAHFAHDGKQYVYRSKGIKLHPDLLLERLNQYVHDLSVNSKANKSIVNLRNDLYDCCLQASDSPQGIYTLTAPTGAGKTLAMMAFALGHCRRHGLKRIIIVLPFLNIIDQSAQAYERVFSETSEDSLILQDHSLAEAPDGDISRLLAQNWDAPIVITTTVRFFEALFANRSTSCRRLHNIARSVVIFDEAQVMPQSLVIPTLAALSFLSQNFGCTTVFSTATQPAFESFDSKVSVYCEKGWQPKEIVTKQLNLFKRARRVKVQWPKEQKSWENICSEALTYPTILVITNLRKHALNLYRLVSVNKPDETFHLSTNMCPAHRLDVLKEVIKRLKNKENCTLISTQCVEAGVDLDFPVVWRAMAPLEAIAQAAGRCNREGQLKQGVVQVFMPIAEDIEYPTADYRRSAIELQMMLKEYGDIDINDPEMISEYYRRCFALSEEKMNDLNKAIQRYDFVETARHYKWIKRIGAEVLVPYEQKDDQQKAEQVAALADEAFERGINPGWVRRARPYAVNVQIKEDMLLSGLLEPLFMRNPRGGISREESGWYVLLKKEYYSEKIGIDLGVNEMDLII